MTPTLETFGAFTVAGITTRTCNRQERDPAQARIGPLWQRFAAEGVAQRLQQPGLAPPRVMGVYSRYASDHDGEFDVLAGVALDGPGPGAAPGVERVQVPAGLYLVFRRQGALPQAVIDTWGAVWAHFGQHPVPRRRFDVDFEAYECPDQVAVCIGVQG